MKAAAEIQIIPIVVAVLLVGTVPAAAQDADASGTVRTYAFVAGSLRERVGGLAVARDVRSLSGRLAVPVNRTVEPWVQLGRFVRPDLECPPAVPCNTDGWTALLGVVLPLSADDTEPGVHPYFVAGAGGAFSTENKLVYLVGMGAAVPLTPRLAPVVEFRWEDLPGIRNVLMATLGLRVSLF